jgi:hypothetical protein
MKRKFAVLLLVLASLPAIALADSWMWNYSGDYGPVQGTVLPGQDTPVAGGRAICSAPRFGQWAGGSFYWTNVCGFPLSYLETSFSFSTRDDHLQDGIRQTGYLFFFGTTKASYVAEEQCSLFGTDNQPGDPDIIYNEGDCGQ